MKSRCPFDPSPARQSGSTSGGRPFAAVLVLSVVAYGVLACSDRTSTAVAPVATTNHAQTATVAWPVAYSDPSLPSAAEALYAGKRPSGDASAESAPTF